MLIINNHRTESMNFSQPNFDSGSINDQIRRISIITVCRNAEASIAETIKSVLQQHAVLSGRVELEYIVQDGMSTDRTLEIVEFLRTPAVSVVAELDRGLYDGLSRAMQRCTGDVVAYINAGDYYHPFALDVVLDIMSESRVPWLTGMTVVYNHRSQVIHSSVPYVYRQRLIRCGMYGTRLPFIQQESTFWRRSLHCVIDFPRLESLKYAGDAFLWFSFAAVQPLAIVQAQLGGFKFHQGQLSENRRAYSVEMVAFCQRPSFWDVITTQFDRFRWKGLFKLKIKNRGGPFFRFSCASGRWVRQTKR